MKKYLSLLCILALAACQKDDGRDNYSSGDAPKTEELEILSFEENVKFMDDSIADAAEKVDADETKAAFTAVLSILDKDKRGEGKYDIELVGSDAPLVFEGERLGRLELWEHTEVSASDDGREVISAQLDFRIRDGQDYFDFSKGAATVTGSVTFGKQKVKIGSITLVRNNSLLKKEFQFYLNDVEIFVDGVEEPLVIIDGEAEGDVAWDYPLPKKVNLKTERPGVIMALFSYTDLLKNDHHFSIYYDGKPRVRAKIHFNHLLRFLLSYIAPEQLGFLTDPGKDGIGYMALSDENFRERDLEKTVTKENFPRTFAVGDSFGLVL